MSIYNDLIELERLLEDVVDKETGEILPDDDVAYSELKSEIMNVGMEKLCKVRANILSDIDGIKEELERISEKKRSKEKAVERLQNYMLELLKLSGKEKVEDGTFTVGTRKSERVIVDEEVLPKQYKAEKITTKPDLKAIKEAIISGIVVDGAYIQECLNLTVK